MQIKETCVVVGWFASSHYDRVVFRNDEVLDNSLVSGVFLYALSGDRVGKHHILPFRIFN